MGSESRPAERTFEEAVDWRAVREGVKQRIRNRLERLEVAELEDLAQEAVIHVFRVVRKEGATNLEGLMSTVAHRTAVGFIRRRVRWRKIMEPFSDNAADCAAPATRAHESLGDPCERVRFTVLEFFRDSMLCMELVTSLFEGKTWSAVAAETGIDHEAVRQRWSRCLKRLRSAAQADPGWLLLREWANG
jgi:DNA-directed RNA polymerase specialized sigma24 family protein